MSSRGRRRGVGVALALGLAGLAVAGLLLAAGRPGPRRLPPAAAAGAALLGMAGTRRKRGARPAAGDLPALDSPHRTLFERTPVQILIEDLSGVEEAFVRLRAEGITNFMGHVDARPRLRQELLGRIRLLDANQPAIEAAGFADREAMMGAFPHQCLAPLPEVLNHQLVMWWQRRRLFEEEFRYLDAQGRERVCLARGQLEAPDEPPVWSRAVLVLLDITAARKTMEAQMESQEVMRQILARANILLWWGRVRLEGGHFRWKINVPSMSYDSPLFQLATAREQGGLWEVDHAPDLAESSRRAERALRNDLPGYQQEFRVLSPAGTVHWLAEDVAIQRLGEDEWNLVGVIRDVTLRREAEEAQRKTQAQLQQLLGRADCMLWQARVQETDGQLHWTFEIPASGLQKRIFGGDAALVRAGVSGDPLLSVYRGFTMPDKAEMDARSAAALRGGAPAYEQGFRLIKGDQTLWLHERVSITPTGPGQWELVGIAIDVTERRRAEEARRVSEAQLQEILERADCLLWRARVVREGDEFRWRSFDMPDSGLSRRLFGDQPVSAGGRLKLWSLLNVPELPEMNERHRRALRAGAADYEQDFRVIKSTETIWLHEHVSIAPAGPDAWNLVGVLVDVTARREAEEARKESEAQLRQTLQHADCVVWQARVQRVGGEYRWSRFRMPDSPLHQAIFGTEHHASADEFWSLVEVPEMAEMNRRSARAFETGAPGYEQEFRVRRDDRTIWLLERASISRVGPDEWAVVGILIDVTARREAEEARKASESQLRQILERADCMLWQARIVRAGGGFQWGRYRVPPSALHQLIFGTEQHPTPDRLWSLVQLPERAEMDRRSTAALLAGERGYEQEFSVVQPQRTIWLLERVVLERVGPGEWEAAGVVIDVTERRRAEAARQASEARLHQLLQQADCLLWQARAVGNDAGGTDWRLYIPPSSLYRELFGADPAEEANLMWDELKVPELAAMNRRSSEALLTGAPGYEQEFRVWRGDRWYWLHEKVAIARVGPREWNLVGVITDISARRTAELALAAEKERLVVTLRAMTEGVVTTDTQGIVQYLNRAAATLTGWEEAAAVGRPLTEVCRLHEGAATADAPVPFAEVLAGNTLVNLPPRTHLVKRDGTGCQVEGCCIPIHAADSALIGTVLVVRDVTERERLEQELARASKLESVGLLAGGIAHDFNNILTVIMGNVTLALLDASELAKVEYYLRETERAAIRARDLTQQLLTFAKGGEPIRAAVHLPDVIREVAEFALHGSRVKCEYDFAPDLWLADADKGQIGQVVQNLVLNSVQAMPEGGIIRIRVANEAPAGVSRAPFTAGDFVRITVADTGTGIRAEHLGKIFDPYFTTKQQGSGLGLATVYSIVKKHLGHIEVESALGRGTTFHIWLPALRAQQLEFAESRAATAPLQGRVLLMDDEETIREMARFLLGRLGFEVAVADDGRAAVRQFAQAREAGRPFDLVVMDLTVPGGMGGQEALAELRKIDPAVKAIVSSGYSSDPVLANHRKYGFSGVVAKPYQLDELTRVLREVLASSPEP